MEGPGPRQRTPESTEGPDRPPEFEAVLYDVLADAEEKDYDREAVDVLRRARMVCPDATSLLDVACGTGRHLERFAAELDCVGVDLDGPRLIEARRRCPGVEFARADMESFELGRTFDIVTCLYSSIGFLHTPAQLLAGLETMARHLAVGGVLIVEPWFQPDAWPEGTLGALVAELPGDGLVTGLSFASRRGDLAILHHHYVAGTATGVTYHHLVHELMLRTWDDYTVAFEAAGLRVAVDTHGLDGRGLLVGRKMP